MDWWKSHENPYVSRLSDVEKALEREEIVLWETDHSSPVTCFLNFMPIVNEKGYWGEYISISTGK